ncbi:hypothetical protein GCM10022199_10820 [Marihabitans asiaticum]|uniref:Uncharacterized protein DUF421 n=2 Tax=Marihabitans asiaticum TaxID=415218 RepID=A0A560WHI7_9MICO|nr:uncharacterized protein DUF421 [Marihabitans asiaticum]
MAMDVVLQAVQDVLTPLGGWSMALVVKIVAATLLMLAYIVVLARTFGTRTFSSFTSYDFLTNVAAGSLVASAVLGPSIAPAAIALLVLVIAQMVISAAGARSRTVQDLVDNDPVVLVADGRILHDRLRRERVSPVILEQQLRQAGVTGVEEVRYAVLESGGTISVITS